MQFAAHSIALNGVEASPIEVQCQLSRAPHAIAIVGLPDKAVKEARERVVAAFYAHALSLPPMRITINLSPAHIPKSGSHFDLPIAIAILVSMGLLPEEELAHLLALGELALNGSIRPVSGVLAAAIHAQASGLGLICPPENSAEAHLLPHLEILAPNALIDLVEHFRGHPICSSEPIAAQNEKAGNSRNLNPDQNAPTTDLAEIRGLEIGKRALEIAAAGRHHLFLVGPPGVGKSMLASALPSIMPDMSAREILETTLVHSAAGLLRGAEPLMGRPYYDPHHTASSAAIIGGGKHAGPGEISLAHNGVLFLDELPEFTRDVLESLRQPLETGKVLIARANAHSSYPARFLLIAAANPCPCGMMFDAARWCGEAPNCGHKYLGRISGPLFDRFSLRVAIQSLPTSEFVETRRSATSEEVRERVSHARRLQYERNGEGVANEDLGNDALDAEIERASSEMRALLTQAAERFGLSPRGYYRLVRLSRTIADLAGEERIGAAHICEAATFRLIERDGSTASPPPIAVATRRGHDRAKRRATAPNSKA